MAQLRIVNLQMRLQNKFKRMFYFTFKKNVSNLLLKSTKIAYNENICTQRERERELEGLITNQKQYSSCNSICRRRL